MQKFSINYIFIFGKKKLIFLACAIAELPFELQLLFPPISAEDLLVITNVSLFQLKTILFYLKYSIPFSENLLSLSLK